MPANPLPCSSSIEPLEARIAPAAVTNIDLGALDGSNGFTLSGSGSNDRLGSSVRDAGDVNGDGLPDFIVGAYRADLNGQDSGRAFVFFGRSDGYAPSFDPATLDGTNGFAINGGSAGANAGYSVSGIGDINGDGIDDVVAGGARVIAVVFGRTTPFPAAFEVAGLNGVNGFRIVDFVAPNIFNLLRGPVTGAGDINGDGRDDLLIGNTAHGDLRYVVLGRQSGFPAQADIKTFPDFQILGLTDANHSMNAAGDFNGDGVDDLLIGSTNARFNDVNTGAAYVIYGKRGGFGGSVDVRSLNGANGFRIEGLAAGDSVGFSVSGAGDVNGDGFDDIIVGATGAGTHGTLSGATFVIFGRAGGTGPAFDLTTLDGTNGFRLNGGATRDSSGFSVSSAGDVNGDGFDDVLVGAFGADSGGDGSGATYVVFGKAEAFPPSMELTALNGATGFRISGAGNFDGAGYSVSAAGDLNGDGFDDILIGAPYARGGALNGQTGAAYVVFGFPTDGSSVPSVTIDDVTLAEGNAGDTEALFTVRLSAPSPEIVSVTYATFSGTAIAPADFDGVPLSTLTFAPGETAKTIAVRIHGDVAFEPDETFRVVLSEPAGAIFEDATGVGTILNDDVRPTITISDVMVTEGDEGASPATFVVRLSVPSGETVSVRYATADGTAQSPEDYTAASGVVTFPPGETVQTLVIDVIGDLVPELAERFFVNLSLPVNATLGSAQAQAVIDDNEPFPLVTIDDVSLAEGDSGFTAATFTVALSKPGDRTVTVQYSTASGSALPGLDYVEALNATLTFAPGEVTKTIAINVVGDSVFEPDEMFFVNLANVTGALLADGQGAATILNDDVFTGRAEISKNGRAAAFTDADGDAVKVTVNRGVLTPEMFVLRPEGLGFQLENFIALSPSLAGAKLSFKAKPQAIEGVSGKSGDGSVNVGAIDAAGMDLGKVKLKGDLGQIDAGDGVFRTPAVKALSVSSLGALGAATQAPGTDEPLRSHFEGAVGKIAIKGALGSGDAAAPVMLSASGDPFPSNSKAALAIKSLSVGGSVQNVRILAGYGADGSAMNADAAIGKVKVKGNWTASSLVAGVEDVTGDAFGRNDVLIQPGGVADILARIASVTIKGTATGSSAEGDHFGITAEQIGKVKIGKNKPPLRAGAGDVFDLAPDFTIVDFA